MKNFEEFKASREKMDPAARKMSEHQWQQAYEAYCRTRRRSRRSGTGSERKRSRSTASEASSRGSHLPASATPSAQLKQRVRQQSAYGDLRLVVDVLSWVAIGLVVLNSLIRLLVTYDFSFVGLLLGAALKILVIFILRMLAHVLIDIPDITLFRMTEATEHRDREGDAGTHPDD